MPTPPELFLQAFNEGRQRANARYLQAQQIQQAQAEAAQRDVLSRMQLAQQGQQFAQQQALTREQMAARAEDAEKSNLIQMLGLAGQGRVRNITDDQITNPGETVKVGGLNWAPATPDSAALWDEQHARAIAAARADEAVKTQQALREDQFSRAKDFLDQNPDMFPDTMSKHQFLGTILTGHPIPEPDLKKYAVSLLTQMGDKNLPMDQQKRISDQLQWILKYNQSAGMGSMLGWAGFNQQNEAKDAFGRIQGILAPKIAELTKGGKTPNPATVFGLYNAEIAKIPNPILRSQVLAFARQAAGFSSPPQSMLEQVTQGLGLNVPQQ